MKRLFALLLLLMPLTGDANHVNGQAIFYRQEGVKYRVFVLEYSECPMGEIGLPPYAVVSFNSSCGNFSRVLLFWKYALISEDMYCEPTAHLCPSNAWPKGVRLRIYSDTVSLPPCTDWKLQTRYCCRRAAGVTNVQANLYSAQCCVSVEAFVNNIQAANSNPLYGNHPPLYAHLNSPSSVPLAGQDPDGDSIVYQLIPTRADSGNSLPYLSGYSAQQPLGPGAMTLDGANNKLSYTAATQGRFTVALRISEYRAGQLIGYSERDWDMLTTTGAFPTPPKAMNYTPHTIAIKPASTDSLLVSFMAAPLSDTVTVTLDQSFPLPFPVRLTDSTGAGLMTAKMIFTTPDTLKNPFYPVRLVVKDNKCPARGVAWYDMLLRVDSSQTVHVSMVDREPAVVVVPNPSSRHALLHLRLARAQRVHLSITDAVGRTVWTQSIFVNGGNYNLPLSEVDVPAGMYFIRVQPADGRAGKVVKWVRE